MGDESKKKEETPDVAADREREAQEKRAKRIRQQIEEMRRKADSGESAERSGESPRDFVERRGRELDAEEDESAN